MTGKRGVGLSNVRIVFFCVPNVGVEASVTGKRGVGPSNV